MPRTRAEDKVTAEWDSETTGQTDAAVLRIRSAISDTASDIAEELAGTKLPPPPPRRIRTNRFSLFVRRAKVRKHSPAFDVAIKLSDTMLETDGLLTPICTSERDVDVWIDGLIDNLNRLRVTAKEKLKPAAAR